VTADGRTEGARELILALFRLAVADYLGVSYGHDEADRQRRVRTRHRTDAATFLESRWAAHLADLVGLSSTVIWSRARRIQPGQGRCGPAEAA